MYLIFDTETTGFLNKAYPPDHPDQARIVQFAALLLDENFKEIESFNYLIKPDGWIISPGAQAVHGISMEMCQKDGILISQALIKFAELHLQAKYRIAHNLAFDSQMIDIEAALVGGSYYNWKDESNICTMLATTNVCCIPGKFGKFKWPKLVEVYYHLFKEKFERAHDAMADVKACARVLQWLVENNRVKIIKPITISQH